MKVMVIGNGGREHALVWKIQQSELVEKIYSIPGNSGMEEFSECVDIDPLDFDQLISFAKNNDVEFTVVGPEIPLVEGIVDAFQKEGLKIFGPSKRAARIEGSKAYMKKLFRKHNIPTAEFTIFSDADTALNYIENVGAPLVVKTDGLAAGKGAYVCKTNDEAIAAIQEIMIDKIHGENAGREVIIEDFMPGEEVSLFVFTDGHNIYPLESAQDHKAIFDDDKGPNTGGMGAYSPAPILDEKTLSKVLESIIVPTIHALNADDSRYVGVLYAGLMITSNGPKVVEYNCRLGDPEAQPLMMRMKSDIVPLMLSCCDGTLDNQVIEWDDRSSACVVISSEGYPGHYQKNKLINGLNKQYTNAMVFHSGVRKVKDQYLTNGGRVLGITALGDGLQEAISNAYKVVDQVSFEGAYYRKDIGQKGLSH